MTSQRHWSLLRSTGEKLLGKTFENRTKCQSRKETLKQNFCPEGQDLALGSKIVCKTWWSLRALVKPDCHLSVQSSVHLSSYTDSLVYDTPASCLSLILEMINTDKWSWLYCTHTDCPCLCIEAIQKMI